MRHIIDKVIFKLRNFFLPEDDEYGENERHTQNKRENKCWYHKTNRTIYVTVHRREVNF